jgi:hypothetical protein
LRIRSLPPDPEREGTLIGGVNHFIDFVPAGGSTAFEISDFQSIQAAKADVIVDLTNLSLS